MLLVLISYLGGVISILSPCSGVLLPAYFSMLLGKKDKLVLYTLVFALGIFTITIPLGVSAVFIFKLLANWGNIIFKIIGIIFILASIYILFGKNIKFGIPLFKKNSSIYQTYLLGLFSALSIGTCVGPIVGAISTIAAGYQNIFYAVFLMIVYSLGILTPFVLFSFGSNKIKLFKNIFVIGRIYEISFAGRTYTFHTTSLISSIILFIIGIVYFNFGGSFLAFERFLKIDLTFVLDLQDKLLNLIY